ncbi:hypothetical protein XELAEV_18002430mg [Xenopus laevis]|uniref:Uncharacterized protein n=1 Tax=Xenopus laevis TaxID=8355 RepID=A0A974BPT9_XENLA|nr:hypothetical protein XELAEV_18002430mg [Xenopus laevis]
MYRDYDVQYSQHGPGSYITSPKHKKNANDYGGYSNYSDGNYNEEEEDFVEQLKHYRQAKENTNVAELQCERNSARPWNRLNEGPNPHFQGGFQEDTKPVKKSVNLNQEFISLHTVEHKGKQICKYFLENVSR